MYSVKDKYNLFEDIFTPTPIGDKDPKFEPNQKSGRNTFSGVRLGDRPASCLGITPYNVLVVATSKQIYYTSLTKSVYDHVKRRRPDEAGLRASQFRPGLIGKYKIEGIVDCEWNSLEVPTNTEEVNGFNETKAYTIRGIYEDSIAAKPTP